MKGWSTVTNSMGRLKRVKLEKMPLHLVNWLLTALRDTYQNLQGQTKWQKLGK